MKRKLLGDNKAKISTRGISNLKRFNIIRLFEEIVLFIFTGLFNTTEIIKRSDDIDWDDEDNCSILIEEFNISYIIL